jgi:predicted PurR-regulated permease PerM
MEKVNLTERVFFYIVFLILIILALLMIQPYFTILVVSLISVIILKPVYSFYMKRDWIRGRKMLAASLTLLSVFVILVVPVVLVLWLTASQLVGLFDQLAALDLNAAIENLRQSLEGIPFMRDFLRPDVSVGESFGPLVRAAAQTVADFAVSLGAALPKLMLQGIIFIVVVATLLPTYDALLPKLVEISPLGVELSELYSRKITAMIKSLVFGVLLVAVIQGVAMGFFFWLAGLPFVFLLAIASMLLALIPMVGISWLVIAIAIVSLITGNWTTALIVLGGFYGVVNWIDVLLRPKLLMKDATINFALFLLSIFGGIAWAGLMGLFYGPVIMLLLVTTIQIYAERYAHEDIDMVGEAIKKLGNSGDEPESATEPGQGEA